MSNLTKQRWCFTEYETKNMDVFKRCRATDEFVAYAADPDSVRGVLVHRDGKVTDLYSDGTAGVTEADKVAADDDDAPTRIHGQTDITDNQIADIWLDVNVNEAGEPFLAGKTKDTIAIPEQDKPTDEVAHIKELMAVKEPYEYGQMGDDTWAVVTNVKSRRVVALCRNEKDAQHVFSALMMAFNLYLEVKKQMLGLSENGE